MKVEIFEKPNPCPKLGVGRIALGICLGLGNG